MAERTGIAWTRSTFNPWIGCTEVSTAANGGGGCDACYARELDARHRYGGKTHWGPGVARFRTSEAYWRQPQKWNAIAEREKASGKLEDKSNWHTPGFWPVFPSMCDPFDNEVPDELRDELFDLIRRTPHLTWLLLTKRIGNAARMLPWPYRESPWQNVWVGASVVNQQEADRDMPKLLALPAEKRFISYEPALGPVDFCEHLGMWWNQTMKCFEGTGSMLNRRGCEGLAKPGIHQIIVGGESNQGKHKARPFRLEWARTTRDQCRAAGVAFFMKQTGSDHTALYERVQKDRAGANPAEWPEDLRVQEFPR